MKLFKSKEIKNIFWFCQSTQHFDRNHLLQADITCRRETNMLGYTHLSQELLNVKILHLPRGNGFLAHPNYLRQLSVTMHVPGGFYFSKKQLVQPSHILLLQQILGIEEIVHTLAKTWDNGYNRATGLSLDCLYNPWPMSLSLYFLFCAVLAICNCKLLKSGIGLYCEMV